MAIFVFFNNYVNEKVKFFDWQYYFFSTCVQ